MHQLATCQDRVRSHDLLPIDSTEGGGKQTKLLDEHNIFIDHDQVSDVKHVCGENEDQLEDQPW